MGYSMNMNNESERVLIPEGWHQFRVGNIEEKTSKAGNMMFVVNLTRVSGAGAIDVYCVAEEGKRWMLKQLLDACRIIADPEGNYNWAIEDVKNEIVEARIEHEPNDWIDREGNSRSDMRARVQEFKGGDL